MNRNNTEFLLTDGEIIILSTQVEPNPIKPGLIANTVEIISLNGAGAPAQPTVGTYSIYVQQVKDGGFLAISDGGEVDATLTAGSLMADGVGCFSSFKGSPYAIKIVQDSVDVATHARIVVSQFSAT